MVIFASVVAYALLSPVLLFAGVRFFRLLASLAPWVTFLAGVGDVVVAWLALRGLGIPSCPHRLA